MKNTEIECSQCGRNSKKGQRFCGYCGQKLDKVCTGCNSTNPPSYKFCGECGKDLRLLGTILLDRTGMIQKMDTTAQSVLKGAGDNLIGKPFSVYVSISDRAFFFSYWNLALQSHEQQNVEVELRFDREKTLNTILTLIPAETSKGSADNIQVEIEDITDRRQNLRRLEEKEKLLDLIFSLTEIFQLSKRKTREKTIHGILEKIGVVIGVQYAFVSRIDSLAHLLFTEFTWQSLEEPQIPKPSSPHSLEANHPFFEKLLKDTTYAVDNFAQLSAFERNVLKQWHPGVSSEGSIICELIYRGHQPVGIIGCIRHEKGVWAHHARMLIKLSAQLISETLPNSMSGSSVLQQKEVSQIRDRSSPAGFDDVELIIDETEAMVEGADTDGKMLIEANPSGDPDSAQRVFATDEGAYVLQCPKCERSELISADPFKNSGWILQVTCPCSCSFRIIREMRTLYRKDVHLQGSFTCISDGLNQLDVAEKWHSMEVENISKNGMKFKSPMTRLLQEGDNVKLRFTLDNSSQALVKKMAIVKSVVNNRAGCQFQHSDKLDTTLGFYFL